MKITKNTIIGELLNKYPQTEKVLKKYLGESTCLTCPGKMYDTVGNIGEIHGLDKGKMDTLLSDLRKVEKA